MGLIKKLAPLILGTALTFLPSKLPADSLEINIFPQMPVYRSTIVDSDISKTEINLPEGLEQKILTSSFADILPYISLSKEIPILSLDLKTDNILEMIPADVASYQRVRASAEGRKLSDKMFSALLVATGSLNFPDNKDPRYTAKGELFLNSPMIDDYLSDGNKLFLVTGVNANGSVKLDNLANENILSVPKMFSLDSYSFSEDLYIVAKSPYSNQYVLLKAGLDNLFGNTEEKSSVNLSGVIEFPPLLSWVQMLKDFRALPYVSLGVKMPLDHSPVSISGELGLKLTGKSEKSIIIYERTDESTYSVGLKSDL
jgi:hypothetical protein